MNPKQWCHTHGFSAHSCDQCKPPAAAREAAAPRLASWAATLQVAIHTENWGAVAEVQEAISAALAAEGES
jgi:hypothetical protein